MTETISTKGAKKVCVFNTPYKDIKNCMDTPDINSPIHLVPPTPLSTLNTPNIFEEMEKLRVEQENLLNMGPNLDQVNEGSTFLKGLDDIPPLNTIEHCQPDNIIQLGDETVTTELAQSWETWGQTSEAPDIQLETSTHQEPQIISQDEPTEKDSTWQEKVHQEVTFDPQEVFKTSMWYHIDHMGVLTSIMDETTLVQGVIKEGRDSVCMDQGTQTIIPKVSNMGVMAVQNTREVGVDCVHPTMDTGCQTRPNMCGSSTQTLASTTTDMGTQCQPEKIDAATNTPDKVRIPMALTMEILGNKDTKFEWCHDQ
jgi:hypothetical protein